jgi:hypothetical protein
MKAVKIFGGAVLGLALLYVLSIGPAFAINERKWRRVVTRVEGETMGERMVEAAWQLECLNRVYAPLLWTGKQWSTWGRVLEWYRQVWVPEEI